MNFIPYTDFCSIVVDRAHEAMFLERVTEMADKRHLANAVQMWSAEREYEYLVIIEDHSNIFEVVFVSPKRFAETLASVFTELSGAKCIWLLFIGEANHDIFDQVLAADAQSSDGHRLN